MRLLLDTCIVYDWLMGEIKHRPIIERIQAEGALVSSVTVWEMAIKNGLGKMPLPSEHIAEDIEAQGFQWLNITPYHVQTVLELDDRHKDPFNRLLIAQAKYEKLHIVTYDAAFRDYLDDVLVIKK
ncbi:type II toxin-antitoxin system VapC family toxin [Methylobacter sp. Wu8]|uniref:type II toxin-antitoxin system VapC family toxin n=1 Tax=Methylobacter sp. Wu8 TaxID=3118457 RepID=UPI002F2BE99D